MKTHCKKIRNQLSEHGAKSLAGDPAAQEHLANCAGCFEYFESIAQLDDALERLAQPDASDAVVDRLMGRIGTLKESGRSNESASVSSKRHRPAKIVQVLAWISKHFGFRRALAIGFACVIIIAIFGALTLPNFVGRKRSEIVTRTAERQSAYEMGDAAAPSTHEPLPEAEPRSESRIRERKKSRDIARSPAKPAPKKSRQPDKKSMPGASMKEESAAGLKDAETFEDRVDGDFRRESAIAGKRDRIGRDDKKGAKRKSKAETSGLGGRLPMDAGATVDRHITGYVTDESASSEWVLPHAALPAPPSADDGFRASGGGENTQETKGGLAAATGFEYDQPVESEEEPAESLIEADQMLSESLKNEDVRSDPGKRPSKKSDAWDTYSNERSNLENLSFKEPEGYWANTYVPGDPVFRGLDARLAAWDRDRLKARYDQPFHLDRAARRPGQPFDPPKNAALAVYLHADRQSITEESRLMVQVGLKAAERLSGMRQGMNVGIVVDLTDALASDQVQALRSLLFAFERAKDFGDRFRLVVAGRPGGLLLAPETFTYGYLTVTLKHLFEENAAESGEMSLIQAMKTAIEGVSGSDDPAASLGSSEVILVTGRRIGSDVEPLSAMAHESAVAGVPVSVVGVGGRSIDPRELDRIVLAGQGSRRLLLAPDDAESIVERELNAVSRVVARTIRLRIRLAADVKLVDVLGSYRMDRQAVKRVKEAEKSIDLRIARNLGIEADRGEDEDGIQIIIPTFYAGDAHVILLDVVARGPGPVAEVTARYKDLVKLRNGTTHANLALERGESPPGPLELNVTKNRLAFELSKVMIAAGDLLLAGDPEAAEEKIELHIDLLTGLQHRFPALERDADMRIDIDMLTEYQSLLNAIAAGGRDELRNFVADSLHFAGRLKVLPKIKDE